MTRRRPKGHHVVVRIGGGGPPARPVAPRPAPHRFRAEVRWTGDQGSGTSDYRSYSRAHTILSDGHPLIPGSSDPAFRGDPTRYNPEELLVASLSACHMLWYLHLAATHGIRVVGYVDRPEGTLQTEPDGGGRFTEVVLRPHVTISGGHPAAAKALHENAHRMCFISSSVNFPIRCEPTVEVREVPKGPVAVAPASPPVAPRPPDPAGPVQRPGP